MSVLLLERQMVHYEVLGRGRPVLLLHGWVGSWRYWIPVMQAASISYRTYAIDQWGYGDSSKSAGHYSLAQQLGLIDTFLEQMGILDLAGKSIGQLSGGQQQRAFLARALAQEPHRHGVEEEGALSGEADGAVLCVELKQLLLIDVVDSHRGGPHRMDGQPNHLECMRHPPVAAGSRLRCPKGVRNHERKAR